MPLVLDTASLEVSHERHWVAIEIPVWIRVGTLVRLLHRQPLRSRQRGGDCPRVFRELDILYNSHADQSSGNPEFVDLILYLLLLEPLILEQPNEKKREATLMIGARVFWWRGCHLDVLTSQSNMEKLPMIVTRSLYCFHLYDRIVEIAVDYRGIPKRMTIWS